MQKRFGWLVALLLLLASCVLAFQDFRLLALWPSLVALLVVFSLRSAAAGLFVGALAGGILLSEGAFSKIPSILWLDQFWPIFQSEWKLSAIVFTLILGGFVALIEAGGGLQALLKIIIGTSQASAKRMQLAVSGFGLMVFFDGLANTMLVGRLLRTAADRAGVSRVKLAYLADATGSAVACLAFISTWIAFQLSMIREGFAMAGEEVNAYSLFFQSLPTNFYCWFALVMVFVSATRGFNPGPMKRFEEKARLSVSTQLTEESDESSSHWVMAIAPIAVLVFSIPICSYMIGAEKLLPFNLQKFAEAYSIAEKHVPKILVLSSLIASITAAAALLIRYRSVNEISQRRRIGRTFLSGVRDLSGPVCILLAAWMLGSAISQLGAAQYLSEILEGNLPRALLPLAIFITGALISFSTGTSWGTMGVLMPLAIPVIFALTNETETVLRQDMVIAAIGAVFSGAVFGDHCSPFSDTTIVASVAAGVEPLDHVRTQMPFALITAGVAAIFGFVPLGFGLSPFVSLLLGLTLLLLLPSFTRRWTS
ncbi:MAG: Na+/H+ antiporter NhaC family protein [Verrucomicrobiota bacterium]